mmetsp:Transcript_131249/g.231890  ORF Transcript_131249/g.231890 Transcript_131249/m.231890 type:complete len:102 (-) Transcript_131249:28-333(-)
MLLLAVELLVREALAAPLLLLLLLWLLALSGAAAAEEAGVAGDVHDAAELALGVADVSVMLGDAEALGEALATEAPLTPGEALATGAPLAPSTIMRRGSCC